MPTTENFWNQMGAYKEDCILFVAGVYGLVMLARNWKIIGRRQIDE
ncbi:MAG: hypothetical protein U9M91_01710 [Chloroflexota bacterium]|nr:hypothetical protein [Chloroflexota bacterium]